MKRSLLTLTALFCFAGTALADQPQPQQPPSPGQAFLMQFDSNKDQQVSLEEFLAPPQEQFKYMDKNSDGAVTTDEVETFANEMRQRMMQKMQQMQQQAPKP
ncbi:MAG: EF-hand domain-containing protein [Gammaproteobacteria bacterium]|nr:EF-hand domain-containing protein [Gammaproteobacteria bacterium]MBU1656167.1 EF-hand domain-containing protein [Gammaproteobacteria bacterium]MBU1961300.1 EF-hand domain-containing protein [Gammaproteobacteria bacterium]